MPGYQLAFLKIEHLAAIFLTLLRIVSNLVSKYVYFSFHYSIKLISQQIRCMTDIALAPVKTKKENVLLLKNDIFCRTPPIVI